MHNVLSTVTMTGMQFAVVTKAQRNNISLRGCWSVMRLASAGMYGGHQPLPTGQMGCGGKTLHVSGSPDESWRPGPRLLRHGLEQTYPADAPDPFPYARFHLTNVPLHIIQKFPVHASQPYGFPAAYR